MDLYWKNMLDMYKTSPKAWLGSAPSAFGPYMKAYKYLRDKPKFAVVLADSSSSGDGKNNGDNNKKKPSAAVIETPNPPGRNSGKKAKAANMMVQKVAEAIQLSSAKATNDDGSGVASSALKLLESMSDKFDEANECMADAVTAQVMAMAPTPERKEYFTSRINFIKLAQSNQRQKLLLEQKELQIKEAELKQREAALKNASMPSLPVAAEFVCHENGCCYPGCDWANGNNPPDDNVDLKECTEDNCPNRSLHFHHVCMVNYLGTYGIDPLRDWCYTCSQKHVQSV